jgi:hypothetical protein
MKHILSFAAAKQWRFMPWQHILNTAYSALLGKDMNCHQ